MFSFVDLNSLFYYGLNLLKEKWMLMNFDFILGLYVDWQSWSARVCECKYCCCVGDQL